MIHYQELPLFYVLWKCVQDITTADLFCVCVVSISLCIWIRMAQNRLVNYRHLLSKRGVCCQVLQHEVGEVLRGEKVEPGVELARTSALPCAPRLSLVLLSKLWEQLSNGNPHTHFAGLKCHLLNTFTPPVTDTAQQLYGSFNRQSHRVQAVGILL